MGRSLTSWNDTVCIYNHDITSIDLAKQLLKDTESQMNDIKTELAIVISNPSSLKEDGDERSMKDIIADFLQGDYSVLNTYAELSKQKMLLEALINKMDEGELPHTEWGHYGDFDIYSAVEN